MAPETPVVLPGAATGAVEPPSEARAAPRPPTSCARIQVTPEVPARATTPVPSTPALQIPNEAKVARKGVRRKRGVKPRRRTALTPARRQRRSTAATAANAPALAEGEAQPSEEVHRTAAAGNPDRVVRDIKEVGPASVRRFSLAPPSARLLETVVKRAARRAPWTTGRTVVAEPRPNGVTTLHAPSPVLAVPRAMAVTDGRSRRLGHLGSSSLRQLGHAVRKTSGIPVAVAVAEGALALRTSPLTPGLICPAAGRWVRAAPKAQAAEPDEAERRTPSS